MYSIIAYYMVHVLVWRSFKFQGLVDRAIPIPTIKKIQYMDRLWLEAAHHMIEHVLLQ